MKSPEIWSDHWSEIDFYYIFCINSSIVFDWKATCIRVFSTAMSCCFSISFENSSGIFPKFCKNKTSVSYRAPSNPSVCPSAHSSFSLSSKIIKCSSSPGFPWFYRWIAVTVPHRNHQILPHFLQVLLLHTLIFLPSSRFVCSTSLHFISNIYLYTDICHLQMAQDHIWRWHKYLEIPCSLPQIVIFPYPQVALFVFLMISDTLFLTDFSPFNRYLQNSF